MFTGLFIDSFQISPYVDLAKSDVSWSISAGPGTNYTPNILSELSFRNVKSRGAGLTLAYLNKLNDHIAFYVEGDLSDGDIQSGNIRDSDYLGDNRTGEFSRSYSEASGDSYQNKQGAMGFKYRWLSNHGHYFSVLVGTSDFQYDIQMRDGIQAIPLELAGSALPGLNSSYDSTFSTQYFALITEHVFSFGTLGLRLEQHQIEFDAKANWNLRDDLAHPTSFAQTGEGNGHAIVVGYSYAIDPSWDIYLNLHRRHNVVDDGYDHTFASDGSSVVTRLNKYDFEAIGYQAGFRYIF